MSYSSEAVNCMKSIEEDGFILLKNLVDKELVHKAAQSVRDDHASNSQMWLTPNSRSAGSFMLQEELMHILDMPLVSELSQITCGFDHRVDHVLTVKSSVTVRPQGVKNFKLNWLHGGPFSNGGLNHYLPGFPLDAAFPRCGRLNLAIPLTPGSSSIGNLVFLKGSHVYTDFNCCIQNQAGMGGAPVGYLENLQKRCPLTIPEVEVGDLFFFVDSLFHGTTNHSAERITVYFMLTKGTATLMDYNTMARPYLDVAKTENQKLRFMPPWYFTRNKQAYAKGDNKFCYNQKLAPFPISTATVEENRIKRCKKWT